MNTEDDIIEQIRGVRLDIAEMRGADITRRYPEISIDTVGPLSNEEIIELALKRELQTQRAIRRDLQADKKDG